MDPLALYLDELDRLGQLTALEEVRLRDAILLEDDLAIREVLIHRLIVKNLRFVVSVAKTYQHRGVSLADLIAAGNLGMVKAAERFDYARRTRFISYAVFWIRVFILAALRGEFIYRDLVTEGDARVDQTPSQTDLLANIGQRLFRQDFLRAFASASSTLTDRERIILTLYFGLGDEGCFTLDELADMFEVTRERIRQIKTRALERLAIQPEVGFTELAAH